MALFKWWTGGKGQPKAFRQHENLMAGVPVIKDDQPLNPFTEIQILSEHKDIVKLLLKVDEHRFISVSDDGLAILWNVETGQKLVTYEGHNRPITNAIIMKSEMDEEDGNKLLLVTASSDRTICIWSVDTGERRHAINHNRGAIKVLLLLESSIGGSSSLFCSGGQDLCLWNQEGVLLGAIDRKPEEDIDHLLLLRNNRVVVASCKLLCIYSLVLEEKHLCLDLVRKLPSHTDIIKCLVNVSDTQFASGCLDGSILLWSSSGLTAIRQLNINKDYTNSERHKCLSSVECLYVTDGYIFAAIGHGFCLFDVNSYSCILEKKNAHYSKILHLSLIFDGNLLATASEDGTIRLWGFPGRTMTHQQSNPNATNNDTPTGISQFLGSGLQKKLHSEAVLLGECVAHSGAVNTFLDYETNGIVSCGIDQQIILWKDGVVQAHRRNQLTQEILKHQYSWCTND